MVVPEDLLEGVMPDTNSEGGVRGGPKRRLTTGSENHRDQRSSCKKKKKTFEKQQVRRSSKKYNGRGARNGEKDIRK